MVRKLSKILDLADDAIISVDSAQRIVLFNQGAERMFGYSTEEVMQQPLDILLPERVVHVHQQHIRDFGQSGHTARRMGERQEIRGRRKDGSEFPAEASISKVEEEEGAQGEVTYTVIMRDVTTRALFEDRLRASLREKEVLLEEVHHRVKNNLQVVSSLLGLQARSMRDPEMRRRLHESQARVQSMALLHECLYQSEDLAHIDFANYLQRLSEQLFHSYGPSPHVQLKTALDRVFLDMDAAVPCGLIVNELLSNSLKYGFIGRPAGEVRVELRRGEGESVKLTVADNGVGLPVDFDWSTSRTLGLRLVRMLAQQLHAIVELSRAGGTAFVLSLPLANQLKKKG